MAPPADRHTLAKQSAGTSGTHRLCLVVVNRSLKRTLGAVFDELHPSEPIRGVLGIAPSDFQGEG